MKAIALILLTLFQFQASAGKKKDNVQNSERRTTEASANRESQKQNAEWAARLDQLDQHNLDILPPNTVLQFLNPFVAEIKTDRSLLVSKSNEYHCFALFAPDEGKRRESREGLTFQISSVTHERRAKYTLQGTGFPAAVTAIECVNTYGGDFSVRTLRNILSQNNAKFTLAPSSGF